MLDKSDEKLVKQASNNANLTTVIYLIIVFALFFVNYIFGLSLKDDSARSAFGSQFGAAAALFSGLAFVGLIRAITIQSQELQLQREELKLTRKEMENTREEIEGQKKALELQSETMLKQQFEATFFTILDQLNRISKRINEYKSQPESSSWNLFHKMLVEIIGIIRSRNLKHDVSEISKTINSILDEHYYQYSELVNYKNVLFNLLKYIDNSNIEDKIFYVNFIKDSFTQQETRFHFYFGIFDVRSNIKFYLEKYSMLNLIHLSIDDDEPGFEYIKNLYKSSIFNELRNTKDESSF
jgi:Putative phage abortive infection protein